MNEWSHVRTVADVPEEAVLLTDSQDVFAVYESIGYRGNYLDYGCLFVLMGEAEEEVVWGCYTSTPYGNSVLDLIYKMGE